MQRPFETTLSLKKDLYHLYASGVLEKVHFSHPACSFRRLRHI